MNHVYFLADEAGNLGNGMQCFSDALFFGRGFGTHLLVFLQGEEQLKLLFGELAETAKAQCTQVFMNPREAKTAEGLVKTLGQSTIQTVTTNRNYSDNTSVDHLGHESRTTGWTGGSSTQQIGRNLLNQDELRLLGDRSAITITPGLHPVLTRVVFDFDKEFKQSRISEWFDNAILPRAFTFGSMAIGITAFLWWMLVSTLRH